MEWRVLLDGLAFAEGPRWRGDRLWFSDVHAGEVRTVDEAGTTALVASIPGGPSGLGWLPDGDLLVARGQPAQLLRLRDGGVSVHADLAGWSSFPCNDMVVDGEGRAWVGCCDIAGIPSPQPSELLVVDPDGTVEVVDRTMRFPNGSVLLADGRLVVAETSGASLTAFTLDGGRALARHEFASLPGVVPDGICLDAEGGVWVADPVANECVRVEEGGRITDRLDLGRPCFACTLGGIDGRTLFVITGKLAPPKANLAKRPGRIEAVRVDVPGAGSP